MFETQVPLQSLTTLKVGGPAEFFVVVKTEAELKAAVATAQEQKLPIHILGGGSNVLVPDEGVSGVVLKIALSGWSEVIDGTTIFVTVGAGEVLDQVVDRTAAQGYWGLENLSHIPGSVGATPVQNVGAYGVEVKDLITEVRALNITTMEVETLTPEMCQFGYRDSIFKHEAGAHYIICSVTFALSTVATPKLNYKDVAARFADDSTPSITAIREAVIAIRSNKFPDWQKVGTAGSFFKNPIVERSVYEKLRREYPGLPGFDVSDTQVKIPLGWILDNVCNLRGVTEGSVGTYERQALVLINHGGSGASEITAFAQQIADKVKGETGLTIEWEVTRW